METILILYQVAVFLKKNQNAPRLSEHPPVRGGGGGNVKTFRWDQRLQITKPLHGI